MLAAMTRLCWTPTTLFSSEPSERTPMATIVLHTQGTLVEAHGRHLRITTPDGVGSDLPLLNADRVHCYGRVQVTTNAIHLLADQGRDLVWFSRRGRLRARLTHQPCQGLEVRRAQYRLADDRAATTATAGRIVSAKIHNQRAVLLRAWRGRDQPPDQGLLDRLDGLASDAGKTDATSSLLGLEGAAAAAYFPAWAAMLAPFVWAGRNRRPPRDPLNILLSLGYTMLTNEVQAQAEALGCDVWLGILHGLRPGRAALALDLVEALRPVVIDRLVLDLISHRRLGPEHFECPSAPPADQEGAVRDEEDAPLTDPETGDPLPRLTADGFRRYLTAYEKRMQHRSGDDDVETGLRPLVAAQAADLARALREGHIATWQPYQLRT